MKYYAKLSGTLVTAVMQTSEASVNGWTEIASPIDWQQSPSDSHRPHVIEGSVVWQDNRTLAEVKAAKWEAMKVSRTTAIDAYLVTPYGTFDSGPEDRTNITDAVLLVQTMASLGTPITVTFTRSDNTAVELTTTQMVSVGLLLGAKVQAAYATARALRAAIEAATTIAAVDAVAWPAP